jgi:hypothetical protein
MDQFMTWSCDSERELRLACGQLLLKHDVFTITFCPGDRVACHREVAGGLALCQGSLDAEWTESLMDGIVHHVVSRVRR